MVVRSVEILGVLVAVGIVDRRVRSAFRIALEVSPLADLSATGAAGDLDVAVACRPTRAVSAAVILRLRSDVAEDDSGVGASGDDSALEVAYESAYSASCVREYVPAVDAGLHSDVSGL